MRVLILTTLALFLVACSKPEVVNKEVIRPIAWTTAKASALEQIRTLSGIVSPVEDTKLSFEVIGKVENVYVRLGNHVSKGEKLASLNQRSFNLSVQSAQAQLEQAQAGYSEAKSGYQRYKKLIDQGLVSQSGFDNAKAAFETSKSAVDVAQAQVDIANKNLQDSILKAPYDGIITKRLIEPSQQISAGQPGFEIEGNHGLEVHVMVPETMIRDLTQDAIIPIRFPALRGVTMQGRIAEIGTRAESANAFPVTVVLKDRSPLLRAGMTAEVDFRFQGIGITGYQGNTITVPITALSAGADQKTYVFVYDEESSVVRRREVQTENVMENQIYLSSGLKSGEIIAIAGVAFLRDGQKVTLLDKQIQQFN